ncbi:hypothetical protein TWF718_002554 [Orbilia javanica]|uniref:Uncharacterized protein n=1 Tax=Orbilia javanica TaxID=47235 RepID=A0AAN8MUD5_9PEZI
MTWVVGHLANSHPFLLETAEFLEVSWMPEGVHRAQHRMYRPESQVGEDGVHIRSLQKKKNFIGNPHLASTVPTKRTISPTDYRRGVSSQVKLHTGREALGLVRIWHVDADAEVSKCQTVLPKVEPGFLEP